MAKKYHPFEDAERKGRAARRLLGYAVLAAAVLGVGGVGFIYLHNHTATALTRKGELALVQHDAHYAVMYLTQAVHKNPGGDLGIRARNLLSKAMIEDGREGDAREYVGQVLQEDAKNADALQNMADSYVHPSVRRYYTAIRPLSVNQSKELFGMIEGALADLGKLPRSAVNVVAMAQLQRLYNRINVEGQNHAKAELQVATMAGDQTAINVAKQDLSAFPEPAGERSAKALELLAEAWKLDPHATDAPKLLAQYQFEDGKYKDALATYQTVKQQLGEKGMPQALAITAADALMADDKAEPDHEKRYAAAQGVLEDYLKEFPTDYRVTVAVGQVEMDRNQLDKAADMAQRSIDKPDADADARILLVNVRLREKKTADALSLLKPMLQKYAGTPEVWYLNGEANGDAGNFQEAEDAFRKARTLNPNYTAAKRAMLTYQVRGGNQTGALLTAKDVLADDRFYMPAWAVVTQDWRDHGQAATAKRTLQGLAADRDLPADARGDLAALLLQVDAVEDAQGVIDQMAAGDPLRTRLEAQLAATKANTAESRAMMADAVKAQPTDVGLRIEYVGLLAKAGLQADAQAQLDEATKLALTPDEALRLARAYLALRLPEAAEKVIQPVLADHPGLGDAAALQRKAEAMRTGKPEAETGDTASADTASAAEMVRLANQALDAKDGTTGLDWARKAISKDANNSAAYLAAGRAHAMLGRPEEASPEIIKAATLDPTETTAFSTFIDVFSKSPELAKQGITDAQHLEGVNPALEAWVLGKLSESLGDMEGAKKLYAAGIDATARITDPRTAKDVLYTAIITLAAKQKDTAAVRRLAEEYAAKDPYFAAGLRMLATDRLMDLDDVKDAQAELEALKSNLTPQASARIVLGLVQRLAAMGHLDEALALLKERTTAADADPQLLAAYAGLLQKDHPDESLAVRRALVKRDPGNPQYQVALAQALAGDGDVPGAMAALDQASGVGETGKALARAARLRYYISAGLLKAAADELATADDTKDFASLLAVGRGWQELKKTDEAKAQLEKIPPYAVEYPAARIALAAIKTDGGDAAAGAKDLETLATSSSTAAQQASVPLFHTLLAAGEAPVAAELARSQQAILVPNTGEWRAWTLLAAMAAREGRNYKGAIDIINTLDDGTRKASGLDIALLELLQGKAGDTKDLANDGPAYNGTFVALENGAAPSGGAVNDALSKGNLSVVLAALAAKAPADRTAAVDLTAKNTGVIADDLRALLNEAGASADSADRLKKLALAERLQEAGWSTAALDTLDALDKQSPTPLTEGMIIRHQALTTLSRHAEADKVRDMLADRFKSGEIPPTVRILLAASWAKEGRNAEALQILQPLAATQRADILTSLATLQERLGHLDEAVSLHRQVRKIAPDDIVAANNLAYTLLEAHPDDKAALAEARTAIEFAISKAPQVTVFQDTLGWIEIQDGHAEEGTRRIAKVLPSLHLDPAVHYHLGIGYARTGQAALARMNLEDVAVLSGASESKTPGPEVAMAAAALKGLK